MPITTILCDLDGTLVDSRLDITMAFQQAWRTAIGGTPPGATAIAQHIGKPLAEMLRELGGLLSPPLLSAFLTAYRHTYARQGACLARPYPEVIATLRALSTLTLGIVTTKEPGQADIVLRRLALAPFFQHVQGGTPGLRLKPAPDTILAALAVLRCAPPHALMVGDTPADVLAGQAAGTMTCAVTYGFGRREALLQCAPDYVIDTFDELKTLVRASNGCGCRTQDWPLEADAMRRFPG
jgi:HAD superfamily hydrolase (TIGR01509 family)